MKFAGKNAVVTGAASGIGRAIALALAERGANVVVADIEQTRAQEVAAEVEANGVRAVALACDVSREDAVEELATRSWEHFGRIDAVFNNAGVNSGTMLLDSTTADLEWLFSVNVFGIFHGCRIFGRRFRDQGGEAWICNTGSEHSLCVPHIQSSIYNATKHAVLGMSDVLRKELPPEIGVSVLCPGIVATEFWNAARNRPDALGGKAEGTPDVKAITARGIDASEIGRRAVEGVERGDFLIVTHSHVRDYVDKRYQEVAAAFESQAPRTEGDERYDVMNIVMDVASHLVEPDEPEDG